MLAFFWRLPASAQDAGAAAIVRGLTAAPELIETQYQLPMDRYAPSTAAQLLSGIGHAPAAAPASPSGADKLAPAAPPPSTEASGLAPGFYGPAEPQRADGQNLQGKYRTFGSQIGRVKWEIGAALLYYTVGNGEKLFKDPQWPHFHHEGFFGRSTLDQGIDKLAHAYSSYVLSEIFYARLKHKTDGAPGIQFTAAAIGFGTMLYTELWDSIEPTAGWSWEDVSFNALGAGFSVLRNSVPGLDRKLDYRLMIMPVNGTYKLAGKEHFEAQRYFFALKLGGFHAFEKTPLRFLELHLGYHAQDFTNADREAGVRAKRKLFVGMGINLRELFFKDSTGWAGKAAGEVLDYFQPPYTTVHADLTD